MKPFQRILLAEDDPHDVELTLLAFSEYNLANDVIVVRDGAKVLDYLYRRGTFAGEPEGNPALILLDLKLPKLDGTQVLQQIKSDPALARIPVVVLTGSRRSRDLETCYRLGASGYVLKPVVFQDFVETVKQIGAFWALVNEPPPN